MGLGLVIMGCVGTGPKISYSGFHAFRSRLFRSIGGELDEMEGFGGERPWSGVDDPLVPLLNHSDCEGELSSDACARIAPRLREVVAGWVDDPADVYRSYGLKLADAMDRCVEADGWLEFC
jgi:hypothetical protein